MDSGNIQKIWGLRKRILLTETSEIDLLEIHKDCFSSVHYHVSKLNRFVVLSGKLRIETELGWIDLEEGQSHEVKPPLIHRFIALEYSTVLELAYVEKGKIKEDDIVRLRQGGRIFEGKEFTEDELRKERKLEFGDVRPKTIEEINDHIRKITKEIL